MDNNGHGQTLHPTRIDIAADVRSRLVTILNHTLAHTGSENSGETGALECEGDGVLHPA